MSSENRQPVSHLLTTAFETYEGPTPWAEARHRLDGARETYWLAVTGPGGVPHVRPVLAVWVDDGLHFASGAATRKSRILDGNPHVAVTIAGGRLDLVVEGEAVRVREADRLRRVAAVYASKYRWPVTVRDGAFYDTEGAPTAGPPPYDVYEVRAARVYGFPTDDSHSPTRWDFQPPPTGPADA